MAGAGKRQARCLMRFLDSHLLEWLAGPIRKCVNWRPEACEAPSAAMLFMATMLLVSSEQDNEREMVDSNHHKAVTQE